MPVCKKYIENFINGNDIVLFLKITFSSIYCEHKVQYTYVNNKLSDYIDLKKGIVIPAIQEWDLDENTYKSTHSDGSYLENKSPNINNFIDKNGDLVLELKGVDRNGNYEKLFVNGINMNWNHKPSYKSLSKDNKCELVVYRKNGRLNNYYDSGTKTITPAYYHKICKNTYIKYYINDIQIPERHWITLYITLPYYVKRYLRKK